MTSTSRDRAYFEDALQAAVDAGSDSAENARFVSADENATTDYEPHTDKWYRVFRLTHER